MTEVQVDLAKRDGPETLWNQILEMGRPLDVACINAGVGVGGVSGTPVWTKNSIWWS